jgi:hypothetical protein
MSKGTTHTPGPWSIPGSANLVGTEGEGRRLVAETHGANFEANAVLIAAAPDMLASLIELTEWLRWHVGPADGEIHGLLINAVAVIASAKGE